MNIIGVTKTKPSRLVAGLVTSLMVMSAVFLVATPPAWACTIAGPFEVQPDDLTAVDFNQADSAMMLAFFDDTGTEAPFTIEGAYLVESVATFDPEEQGWHRGSVLAMLETWGERDARPARWTHDNERAGELDDCPTGTPGPTEGRREIYLVTTPQINRGLLAFDLDRNDEQAAFDALTETFGASIKIERDLAEEQRLLAMLQTQHDEASATSRVAFAVGFGALLLGAGMLSYWKSQ